MDFYTYVVGGAIILLIIALIAIGIIITYGNSNAKFPEYQSSCPDYWTYDDTNKNCSPVKINSNLVNVGTLSTTTNSTPTYTPKELCENYKWANDNKIAWDGVSNTNSC